MNRTAPSPRFRFIPLPADRSAGDEIAELRAAFSRRPVLLPTRYFYDDHGSQLFERICALDEYYPTRTEESILARHAGDVAAATGPVEIVELGSGSASKTPHLIDAYRRADYPLHYVSIDVNGEMVELGAAGLLERFDGLFVRGVAGTYEQGLSVLGSAGAPPRMIVFLGSTIGNLDDGELERFLAHVHGALAPGGFFLVGMDLQKDIATLEAAYNDARGVTAAFNLNVLRHLNRRFNGSFVLSNFAHRAFYNRTLHRIEMHLESLVPQRVRLGALDMDLDFAAGERIRTEISRKFAVDAIAAAFARTGFSRVGVWQDKRNWFAMMLCRRI